MNWSQRRVSLRRWSHPRRVNQRVSKNLSRSLAYMFWYSCFISSIWAGGRGLGITGGGGGGTARRERSSSTLVLFAVGEVLALVVES